MRRRLARFALLLARTAVVVWMLLFAAMAYWQPALLYVPTGEAKPPAEAGLSGVSEEHLTTPDGEHLVTWVKPAQPGKPTILYFHGNSGVLAFRAQRFKAITDEGWGLYALAYRGFNGSTGEPTEAHNVSDAELAYETLRARGVTPQSIVVFGESLGSGVAVQVALSKPVAGVVLDSAYTSIADLAALRFPIFPVKLVLQDRYDTKSRIGALQVPLLMFHAVPDVVIPSHMSEALFHLAHEPKQLVLEPEGWHVSEIELHGAGAMRSWMAATGILHAAVAASAPETEIGLSGNGK